MSRRLNVACAQLGPIHLADDRPSVVKRLIEMLREAHGKGCRFVVFPELALTTFFPRYWYDSDEEADRFFEHEMPSTETKPLFEEAARLGLGFYLGYAEAAAGGRYNTSILVGPDGRILGKYRKVHLPGHADDRPHLPFQHLEKKYFQPGDLGFPVWRAFDSILGMLICNDRRWPEAYRVMGLQGVELVALGFNTPSHNIYHPEPTHLRMFHHKLSVQAGAYQNATWVAATAKAGAEDGFHMFGGSCIVAPTGEIMAQTLTEEDEVIAFDCDLDLCRHYKESTFAFERHRRIEHYGRITEQTGVTLPPSS
ncbi:MAG: N-carbamoyl-D-amino-acid hydrolase [Pseudomonadota bacterium]